MSHQKLATRYPQFHHLLLAPKAIASEVRFQFETQGKLLGVYSARVADQTTAEEKYHVEDQLAHLGIKLGLTSIYASSFEEETKADLFADVDDEKKILILAYFLGTLKDFLGYYDIFEDEGPAKEEEYPGQSYIKNQHLLSEKGIFGNMDATKAANVHEVFLFLEEHKSDMKERIKQEKAHDTN